MSFSPPQNIHCKLEPGNGICMIGTNLQIRKIFNFNRPGIIAENNYVESIGYFVVIN
jgi:hypothetical protein